MLQGRLDNYVDISLIVIDPALGQGKWIGSGVLELWEDGDISVEAQVKLQENLIWYFSFFQPFPLEVPSENRLKNVVLTLSRQDRSRAITSSPLRGTFWALPVASWGDTCSTSIAFPQQKWAELWWRLCYPSSRKSVGKADLFPSSEIQIPSEEHLEA